MSRKSLLQERLQLFDDAVRMKKTYRIPQVSNFWTWKILDSEYKLSEALFDYQKMEKLMCDFHQRYQFDGYLDLGTRNPVRVTSALGGNQYLIDDEKEVLNIHDQVFMEANEYPELAENPVKFLWTKILPRKYKKMNETGALENFKNTTKEFLAFSEYNTRITRKFTDEYQVPEMLNIQGGVILHPFEMLFNFLRGIKGLSLDIRKNKETLLEAMDALYEMFIKPSLQALEGQKPESAAFDMYSALLAHSILSTKQFGEIYWPILKKVIDKLVETNKTFYIFSESTMMRFCEFFQEVPKGHLVIQTELDDIFELRKKLPNVCLAGGMPADLLGKADAKTCVDYAKKLVDELGRDGGFIFSQNKMMSFRYDCKRENLMAVTDFVRNYRI